ncbi:MAG TPA: elongation factor G [Lentisphaeria bacterium]|nr:MAG: hypothetical protein A2X47_00240 [Lentisphaerae bacterium GWF2_38_69]HBM14876.1 elongation factor G [Lentisphaeria bacterium]
MSISAGSVRNFAVSGHIRSGKTSLCDLILFKSGKVDRLGKVTERTSVSDYTAEEQTKLSSIYSAALNCKWKDNYFFFMDTPGYGEFIAEPISAINNSDIDLIVVDAVDGVQIGTSRSWKIAKNANMPVAFYINGLDKDMADFDKVLEQIQGSFGKTSCIPVTLPDASGTSFSSVTNILKQENPSGDAKKFMEKLSDSVAESDEELMMKYLDGQKLTAEELSNGLKKAITSGTFVPVFCGSVSKDIGIDDLLNSLVDLMPTPLEKNLCDAAGNKIAVSENGLGVAKAFKTINDPFLGQLVFFRVYTGTFSADSEVYNVTKSAKERFGSILLVNGKNQDKTDLAVPGMIGAMVKLKATTFDNTIGTTSAAPELPLIEFPAPVMSYALTAVKSGEEEKIAQGLNRISAGDPTLKLERHPETHEMLLSGMGDQQLTLAIKKLKEENKVEVNIATPKVPYRETVTALGEGHYRHKKQSGGHGQFAEVYLKVEPKADGYEFVNAIVGGTIPKNFIPAVEKGVVEAMINGPLAGCTVQNIKVTVYDGKFHDVDSSEMAFKIASRAGFRDGVEKAKPILLEPIMNVKIYIPDQYMGDISGDLNTKRGRILGMEAEEGLQVVRAEVPIAELAKYATELRSITQGNGSFEMSFARYEMVPTNVAKEIIEKHKKELESSKE